MEINYIDQRPEISIVDDTVILSLTIQENAASDAINAAKEAEASALASTQSEINAATSATTATTQAGIATTKASEASQSATEASQSALNALTSEQNATNSETNAAASETEAANQAGIATTKANEALTSEQNAATSATEADNAATLSTEQAVLSASARDAAIAAQLAAQNSEDNAATSEANALLSAQAAAASELDAEAARDEIVSKIDFTGAQEGDIYRVNNAGVAVRINETEFLQSKVPFLNSPLAGLIDLDNVFAWDSFSRANTASTLVTDSGHSYVQITGTSGLRIESNFAYKNNASDIIGVNTGFGSVRFINNVRIRPANSNYSFVIGKDANNYVLYQHNPTFGDGIRVSIVIAGVETFLSAQSYFLVFGLSSAQLVANSAVVTFIIDLIRPSEGGMVLRINCPTIPNLNQSVDLSSYRASDYPNASDIAFVGWGFGINSERTGIRSWSVSNIIT